VKGRLLTCETDNTQQLHLSNSDSSWQWLHDDWQVRERSTVDMWNWQHTAAALT